MNRNEFNQWWKYHATAFPDTAAWLGKLPDQVATLEVWADVLSDVELRDAKAVTMRLAAGEDEPLPAYEREQTAAYVKRLCWQNRNRRKARERAALHRIREPGGRPAPVAGSMAKLLLTVIEGRESGKSADEIRAECEKLLPVREGEDRRERFACFHCLDSGVVEVWAPHTVAFVRDEGQLPEPGFHLRTCVVACHCERGERYPHMASKHRYDPERFCRCRAGDMNDQSNREALLEFAPAWHANPASEMQNYHPEFAEF